MNLDRWSIQVNYEPATCDSSPGLAACITADWRYKTAKIDVFVPTMAKMKDSQIEFILVHELSHALVCAMRGKKHRMEMEESVVTEVASALMRTKYPEYRLNV